jgi:hypothetical protein
MNTSIQAQASKQQVVVEQLLQLVGETQRTWDALTKKEKVEAWIEDQFTPAHLRPFNQYHRMVQALEELH